MTASGVATLWSGDVVVVRLDTSPSNPPLSAATLRLRGEVIARLEQPGAAVAVVLTDVSGAFSVASISEPGDPSMADVCLAVAACRVPVVVALNGLSAGPWAELVVTASARVAGRAARVAFPEVTLGLVPQAGASQRLPRLVGAAAALKLLLSGRAMVAEDALAVGLFDAVVAGDPLPAAVEMARRLGGMPLRRTRPGTAAVYQAAILAARAEHRAARPVVGRIIDCVEAALVLPLANGLAFERVAREDLEASPEVAALRSAALAERRAQALPPQVARAQPAPVRHLGLHGSGEGMAALALAALGRGLAVTWVAEDAAGLSDALHRLEAQEEAEQRTGRASRATVRSGLTCGTDPAALEAAGLQVHAVRPREALRQHILPGVPVLVIGGAAGELGLAVSASAKACELALPADEDATMIATAVALLRQIGMPPVLVGQRPVLGRRVNQAGDAALLRLIGLGVPRRIVEAAMQEFGARLPGVALPAGLRMFRPMNAAEVQRRWLGALANEGLKQLDAGVARRPSDIDHVLVAGYQFPRWRGGPMHQADQRGLLVLRRDLRLWAEDDPFWTPVGLLDQLISDGLRLSALDG